MKGWILGIVLLFFLTVGAFFHLGNQVETQEGLPVEQDTTDVPALATSSPVSSSTQVVEGEEEIAAPDIEVEVPEETNDPAPVISEEVKEAIEEVVGEEVAVGELCGEQYWPPCEEGKVFYCPEAGEPYCHAPEELFCNGQHWTPCSENAEFVCEEGKDPVCLLESSEIENIVTEEPDDLTEAEMENLMLGVPRILCDNADGSRSGGSAVAMNADGLVVTNAHVIAASETDMCEVVFPLKNRNGVYAAAHYLEGEIIDKTETLDRFYNEGIDIAYLQVLPDANNSSFFEGGVMHHVEFPICEAVSLGDTIVHVGYASNLSSSIYSQGDALSTGEAIVGYFGDVATVTPEAFVSEGQVFADFEYSWDDSLDHQLVISVGEDTKTYYGSSGGLAFNKNNRCVQGVMAAFATNEERTVLHTHIYNLGYPGF